MSQTDSKSLFECFSAVPDPRKALGKQHPLPALLTLATLALLCGARGLSAIAQWGVDHEELAHSIGFIRKKKNRKKQLKMPCTSTFHYIFKALDTLAFEAVLTQWLLARAMCSGLTLNIDGKTLRGSHNGAVPGVHLVAAYSEVAGTALAQLQVDVKTNEHKAALQLLKVIPMENTLITGDAMFAQKDFCQETVNRNGDYFVTVKDNQPTLKQNILDALKKPFFPGGERCVAGAGAHSQ